MKLRAITLLILLLFTVNISTPSIAATDIITKEATKIIKNLGIEIAVKGKKLKEYFSGNTLYLSFENKKKEFRFEEKKYCPLPTKINSLIIEYNSYVRCDVRDHSKIT